GNDLRVRDHDDLTDIVLRDAVQSTADASAQALHRLSTGDSCIAARVAEVAPLGVADEIRKELTRPCAVIDVVELVRNLDAASRHCRDDRCGLLRVRARTPDDRSDPQPPARLGRAGRLETPLFVQADVGAAEQPVTHPVETAVANEEYIGHVVPCSRRETRSDIMT